MNNIKLGYPIKLYMKKGFMFFAIIFCILLTCASYYLYDVSVKQDDWVLLVFSVLGMLIFGFFVLACIAISLLNQPTITLNPSSIELFRLFGKNKRIFWSQIESIELDILTHKSVKHWQLIIFPKQGYGKKIIQPLRTMTYNSMQLNEKEIFSVIEQSFNGERPTLKNVKMGLESRIAFNIYFWNFILALGVLIFIFVFGGFGG